MTPAGREVIVATHAGFCAGVSRATAAVEGAMRDRRDGERLFTFGHLIHNGTYERRLRDGGVSVLETEDELRRLCAEAAPDAPVRVFVRAHGMTVSQEACLLRLSAENPSFAYTDCTCPFVRKIHGIVEEQEALRSASGADDRFLVVLGSGAHPEVRGFVSRFRGEVRVFADAAELAVALSSGALPKDGQKQPIFIAQTTQDLDEWEKSKKILKKYYTSPLIFDTICSITESRQREAAALARECDCMVVIGGKRSSNSAKLYSVCKGICPTAVWVEGASELPGRIPSSCRKIGVVAGASTPRDSIEEVATNMSENEMQSEPKENFAELLDREPVKTVRSGDIVSGTVTAIDTERGEIQLDLGAKLTGVIKQDQITDNPHAKLDEMFQIGDKVDAFVIRASDVDGVAELSKKRVDADKNWLKIVQAYGTQENVEGKIVGVNKGGLEAVIFNNRVFIPAAHSGVPRGGDLSALIGQTKTMRILETGDRKRAKASIRLVLRDERRAREKAFWETIEEGKIYTGVVKSMTSYGAFVDLGGVDGMVHCSELSWRRIKSPADVVSVGQEITVYVKSFDPDRKRISLGYKTEATNPWYIFTHQYAIGDTAEVKIVSLMPFGAFAEIVEGVDGLIHISQIADHKIGRPSDELSVGQTVEVKIIDIDNDNQKVSLSIRALLQERRAAAEAAPRMEREETDPDEESDPDEN